MTRVQAITTVANIAGRLRAMAKTDINQDYILWKAKVIEDQLALEMDGIQTESDRGITPSFNDLMSRFNDALAKPRPDFAEILRLQRIFTAQNNIRGMEAAQAIENRAAVLIVEVPKAMELALNAGNIEAARTELAYCRQNREHLQLSPGAYAALEAKFAAATAASDEYASIVESFNRCKNAIGSDDIAAAEREAAFEHRKVLALRGQMIPHEWDRINDELETLAAKLAGKEDGLVKKAERLLEDNEPAAAAALLDSMKTLVLTMKKSPALAAS